MIALTVRQYFLVVNLMAIPPSLWVVLALVQGFLDMSIPARRLVSASAICRNGAPPSSTDMTWKSRRVIWKLTALCEGRWKPLPPASKLCNYITPQYEPLEWWASATCTRWFGPAVSSCTGYSPLSSPTTEHTMWLPSSKVSAASGRKGRVASRPSFSAKRLKRARLGFYL
jgi:hypothetical protein